MDSYPIRDMSRQRILEGGRNRNSWKSIVIIDFAIYLLDTGGSFKTMTLSWSLANSTTSVWPRILSWWSLFSACGWKETIWFTNMSKPSRKPQEKHVYFNCTLEAEVSLLKVANAICFCRRKHNQVSCIYSLHHLPIATFILTSGPFSDSTLTAEAPKYLSRSSFSSLLSSLGRCRTMRVLLFFVWTSASSVSAMILHLKTNN